MPWLLCMKPSAHKDKPFGFVILCLRECKLVPDEVQF